MKKVLLIGGAGYIGSKLAEKLEADGSYEIEVFDKPKDIRDYDEVLKAVKENDIVFHLAALAEINYTDKHPQETFEVNIWGANNVIRACAEEGKILQFVSTSCIYGDPLEKPSVEDRLINPTDAYAMSKAAGEYLVKMWGLTNGLKFNILRFGTVYGPSMDPEMRADMCIQKFLDAAVNKEDIVITGDGEQARCFIHIDDLVRAMVILTGKEDVVGETINLAGKERITINHIASLAIKKGVTGVSHTDDRKDDFFDQEVSVEKAKTLLGWEPEIKFNEAFNENYLWLKDYYQL